MSLVNQLCNLWPAPWRRVAEIQRRLQSACRDADRFDQNVTSEDRKTEAKRSKEKSAETQEERQDETQSPRFKRTDS